MERHGTAVDGNETAMSDEKSQQEPSMEEILASIRRIISEDDAEEGAKAKPDGAAAEAAPAAAEEEPPAAPPPPAEEPEAAAPDDGGDDDVFDLTQMVQEDGSVVDLADQDGGAAQAAEEPPAEEPVAEEPAEEATPGDDEVELRDMEEAAEEEPEPEPAAAEPAVAAAAAVESGAGSQLISDQAAGAAESSLSALAKAVDHNVQGIPLGVSGRTLEDLVKEIMRPMIKDWLDQNLPGLVDRLVRREIERLARRAEDE